MLERLMGSADGKRKVIEEKERRVLRGEETVDMQKI